MLGASLVLTEQSVSMRSSWDLDAPILSHHARQNFLRRRALDPHRITQTPTLERDRPICDLHFPDRIDPGHTLTNENLNLSKLRHDFFRLVSPDSHLLILLY